MADLYRRRGLWGIFISRFLPGVRAIVPPAAGALGIGAFRTLVSMGSASALWYGGITYLAFTAGANFEALEASIKRGERWVALGAGGIVVVVAAVWLVRRRRRKRGPGVGPGATL